MSGLAVIFDCDGVLVDSETLSAQILVELAREADYDFAHAGALAFLRGRKVGDWVAELGQRTRQPLRPDFVAEFRARCADLYARELKAIPFVGEAVAALDLPFCTASSAPREKIELTLALTGLLPHFAGRIFSAYEVGAWKPDPGLFLHAAREMGAAPVDCLVIEDSVVGVEAGVAAGMTVLGFASKDTADLLTAAGARTFASMSELPRLIENWRAGRRAATGAEGRHSSISRQLEDVP